MKSMLKTAVVKPQLIFYRRASSVCLSCPKRCFATALPSVDLNTIVNPQADLGATMPPNVKASVGNLQTFKLPDHVNGSQGDRKLGKALIRAWRRDGILQIAMNDADNQVALDAFQASQKFFAKPPSEKAACIDSQSYAGYIASGEEITDGIADYSEIFTVTKEHDLADQRVVDKWPCHGPNPWPDQEMKGPVEKYMAQLGRSGETLLSLIELGLDIEPGSLTKMTSEGWHHMRILRFPPTHNTNGKGKEGRGIGSHTDYGLLVLAAQDDVGGLFIRPPYQDETFANWNQSTAGLNEDDDRWVYVPPVPGVFTVFPGDMMQYLTNSYLPSTPHKVGLNTRERFALAYFHEPKSEAVIQPLGKFQNTVATADATSSDVNDPGIHYGTHFTNMFMRNYPDRITTARIHYENRLDLLDSAPGIRAHAM